MRSEEKENEMMFQGIFVGVICPEVTYATWAAQHHAHLDAMQNLDIVVASNRVTVEEITVLNARVSILERIAEKKVLSADVSAT